MPAVEVTGEPAFGKMMRQMSKVVDQLQSGFFSFCPRETWTPQVNLYEMDHTYVVCVDLAGVDKEKIDLVVAEGQLRLRGQRVVPTPPREGEENADPANTRLRVHLMEIDHGPFSREVDLPEDVDRDRINASYRNGILWVELPKRP